jgi:hypothetical protein
MDRPQVSLAPLFRANFRSYEGGYRSAIAKWTLFAGIPVLAGVLVFFLSISGVHFSNGIAPLLSAVALLVGAMFSAFVFLTNLRVKLSETTTYAFRVDLLRYVGSSAVSCLYVAIVALVAAGMLALVASVEVLRLPEVKPWTIGVLVAMVAHVGVSLLTVVRRMFAIYFELFTGDFDAPIVGGAIQRSNTAVRSDSHSQN